MLIYNSMTLKKEAFIAQGTPVGVYVCGITPYEGTHLGDAFTYVHFDVLVRYLRHLGYQVVYVQKLTDIDDRIFETAATLNTDWRAVSEANTYRFLADMHWLGNLAPTLLPRATELVPSIIELIERLIESGCAERKNGSVCFKSTSASGFNRLGGKNHAGNPQHQPPQQKDPMDIVLWQSGKPGEPAWESPWGKGRPGRHIECSTMALKFLGPSIDIIGGSASLIYPHHECILAHADCLAGRSPARHWVHTGFVRPNQTPANASSGKVWFVNDMRHWDGFAVRAAILDRHYADSWTFDPCDIRMGKETVEFLRQACVRADGQASILDPKPFEADFYAAMDDNLDMPQALGVLRRTAKEIMRDSSTDAGKAKAFLNRALRLLGMDDAPG